VPSTENPRLNKIKERKREMTSPEDEGKRNKEEGIDRNCARADPWRQQPTMMSPVNKVT
jgi:hypothetical protein